MLSFAEAYDPLWEARVYKDGRKIETVKSIPLYSVINGFWINETGNLEIIIRYKSQDWFERLNNLSYNLHRLCRLSILRLEEKEGRWMGFKGSEKSRKDANQIKAEVKVR